MRYDIHTKRDGWDIEMEAKKLKHNIAACWTAIIINPTWLIVDYLTAPTNWNIIAVVDTIATVMILLMVLLRKRLKLSADFIGVTLALLLIIPAAYVSSIVTGDEYAKIMVSHDAIFLGASMLLIIEMKYSILIMVTTIISNLFFYQLLSTLSLEQYLFEGGLLVVTICVFMIIAIQFKYNLTSRSINSKLILRDKNEQLKIAKKEAEKSKELQSTFLSNMSHEIRTPMNGIIGITRILQNTEMTEEQKNYLNAVISSSQNLMVIINDILDFSKIEAGKVALEERRFDLDETIKNVCQLLESKADEKSIYLKIDKIDDVPTFIEGDQVRLNQILINLVGNAIKFTENGGVTIHVKKIIEDDQNITIRFNIKDTGLGIPADKIDSIFNSFTQASSSVTRTHGGTGLGLTISKQLIELQGGRVWINSILGKGSVFSFEIPYKKSANEIEIVNEKNTKNSQQLLEDLNGIDILLVEDHPINQMLAIKVLSDWGFNVDLAENGKIALTKVSKKNYDLILMDISMPEMDGYTATREIRTGKYTENFGIPIIAMTASALIGENQKCFKAGMDDYISKPFEPQNLLNKISHHVLPKVKRA
jgi:signal transduction histidine kinase/CheY-like chemotaxis protein